MSRTNLLRRKKTRTDFTPSEGTEERVSMLSESKTHKVLISILNGESVRKVSNYLIG